VSQYADLCKRLQMYDKTWFTAPAEAAAAITQLERERDAAIKAMGETAVKLGYMEAERDAALKREQELRTRCEALERDAQRYRWLRERMNGDAYAQDDALRAVQTRDAEDMNSVIDVAIAAREVEK